jgi:hypothetical protein
VDPVELLRVQIRHRLNGTSQDFALESSIGASCAAAHLALITIR